MKWSIYNELIEDYNDESLFLFNSLRGKYFALDLRLKQLITKGSENVALIANQHSDLYSALKNEEFIVPDDLDETEECLQMLKRKFSSSPLLRITVNPTLDCNLKCWYCYESHLKGSSMSQETIEAVARFVEKQTSDSNLEKVHLSFFGGEPLIKYRRIVKPLIEKCAEICVNNRKQFVVSITTNGVCLTPSVVDDILSMGVTFGLQVAFDGNKFHHDSVKHFADGMGTYESVCKNLKYAISHGVTTTIRCNYTNANVESFIDLINDFKPFWRCKTLRFSFHKVWQEPESEELFRKRDRLKRFIVDSEINSNINTYLGNAVNSCYADYDNNVAINYNGDIYRCTARDFRSEHRLGCLAASGEIIYNTNYENFGNNKLTRQCPTCKMLPICTICFQQRVESPDGNCPKPLLRENAVQNIHKYFYDTKYYSSL